MKRLFLMLLCAILVLGLCACHKAVPAQNTPQLPLPQQGGSEENAGLAPLAPGTDNAFQAPPTVLTPSEYVLYTNIFYNETGGDYVGQTFTKTGTLARVEDAYNGCIRWYVWGYNDQTKCCDWQWEIVPRDPQTLPDVGTMVNVSGTFAASTDALDGYWIEDAEVNEEVAYEAPSVDYALTSMSNTLERVQILNMQNRPDQFENRSILAYGRIAGPGEIQDPYYDGSWTQKFDSEDELPAIGTVVVLRGTWHDGVIEQCTVTPTKEY